MSTGREWWLAVAQRQRCAVAVMWRVPHLSPHVVAALGWCVDVDQVERAVAALTRASIERKRARHPHRCDVQFTRAAIDDLHRRLERGTGVALARRAARHRCRRSG